MATHSSVLAWRIPWTEEPGRLQSMGSQSRTRLKQHSINRNEMLTQAKTELSLENIMLGERSQIQTIIHIIWFHLYEISRVGKSIEKKQTSVCQHQSFQWLMLKLKLPKTLAIWCEEPTHWKRSWCWERLRAGGERGQTEDEMVGWHHWLNGHESEQT